MTNPKLNRVAGWLGNVLLLAGLTALAAWAVSFFGLTLWQHWQNHLFDHQRTVAAAQTSNQPPVRIKNGEIVGRLSIPKLHLHAMVREGSGERTLSVALGHIPGTALPGQEGNIGVAGHRDRLFRGLKDIAPNDEIKFETTRATYVYRVETTQIVKPEDVQVLDPGPTRELTLVTCFPFEYIGSAPDRFIVKAQLISENTGGKDVHEEPHRVAAAVHPKAADPDALLPVRGEIAFDVPQGHSKELVPGKIWLGLSSADAENRTVDGWVWVMPERQTIWLRNVDARQPVVFYENGRKRELVITSVARSSARGYLVPRG